MRIWTASPLEPRFVERLVRAGVSVDNDSAPSPDTEGIVIRSETTLDNAMLDRLLALRFVIRAGSGVDNIPCDELQRRRIRLYRNPRASAHAVAELAVVALTALVRRMPLGAASLAHGEWNKAQLVGEPLSGLDTVVWGAGPVGLAVSQQLEPLVARLNFAAWPSVPRGVPTVMPEGAMTTADVHVICLPLRASTIKMFGPDFLASSRSVAPYVVNVGRFELLQLDDAVTALRHDQLRGLAVDATDKSDLPEIVEALGRGPANLLLLPHLGAQRVDVRRELDAWVVETILTEVKTPS